MNETKFFKKIAHNYNLQLIYLFGSRATGRNSERSDIDIAVLFSERIDYNLKDLVLTLIFEFSKFYLSDRIDLINLNKAPLSLQYNVISEGKILYESNSETRYNYEVKIIGLYLDFKRYEKEYFKAIHKRISEGIS